MLDRQGKETRVLEVYPQGVKEVYKVLFTDGREVECGLNHLWTLNYKNKSQIYKTSDLINRKLKNKIEAKGYTKHYYQLPNIKPIIQNEKEFLIKPYTLGFLIGDGNLHNSEVRFSTNDSEVIDYIQNEIGVEYEIRKHTTKYSYGIVSKDRQINKIKRELNRLNLNCKAENKHIPEEYFYGSIEQRFELLRGLMDSDGCISKNSISFITSSNQLRLDVLRLLRSLGIKCKSYKTDLHLRENTFSKLQSYRISISTTLDIFKLSRKLERIKKKNKANEKSYVSEVINTGRFEESTCFLVDNPEHIYLTNDFVPTHNSFKMGAISPCNMYTLPGSGNPNFHLASSKDFLSGDKGIWGKITDTLDWIATYTPLPRMRLVDSNRDMNVVMGYKDPYGVRKGLLSSVTAISLKDNPEKARGVRGPLIHYEEDGLFDNLEKAWNVNRKAVEDGDEVFGYMLAGGTGGTEGASFEGSEKLFYNPGAYNVYAVPNVFDRNADGSTECGFFWGSYMNRNGCYDLDTGEPDVVKALIQVLEDRYIVKYSASDTQAITQKKAEEPITPQEAVMRTEGTVFPVSDLKEYLEEISINKEKFLSEHYVGELVRTPEGPIKFVPDANKVPLRSYDKIPPDRSGCIEIFEMPRKNSEGLIPFGRYIAGIDPIDADNGTSLFSIMVMDLFTDRIVAEYSGRPRYAEDAYEISLRMLEFYNAQANYEQNLKGLFSYFDKRHALHHLCDTPQIVKDMDLAKGTGYGNTAKGTRANKELNKWGRLLQADWQKQYDDGNDANKSMFDEDGKSRKLKLHTLRGIAYIEECIKWMQDGNFDRVSAGGMLMILREDKFKRTESMKKNEFGGSDITKDKFFDRNYKKQTQFTMR